MTKFYDTNALLFLQSDILKQKEKFIISNITLKELEQIKTSGTKDEEIKWLARKVLHLLAENEDKYEVEICKSHLLDELATLDLPISNDNEILITAKEAFIKRNCLDTGIFVTQDIACKKIAETIGLNAEFVYPIKESEYTGFLVVELSEVELANFYNDIIPNNNNKYELYENQYVLLKYNDEIVDKYKWAGGTYQKVKFNTLESMMFGKIQPKDEYQILALDSLSTNQITMLKGPAGSGKTWLSFGYMFDLLEQHKIDKIIIFCNTVATRGSAKLGYYPGSRTEKLLDSQIGNLLESKLGDRFIVEDYISKGKLVLLPLSDIRGYDTSNMNAAIYISEAQNLDIELMKLALQRIGADSICIIDGDDDAQVDMTLYAGKNNGMKRVSKVFRGQSFYGEVKLQHIYRSKIAEIADKL